MGPNLQPKHRNVHTCIRHAHYSRVRYQSHDVLHTSIYVSYLRHWSTLGDKEDKQHHKTVKDLLWNMIPDCSVSQFFLLLDLYDVIKRRSLQSGKLHPPKAQTGQPITRKLILKGAGFKQLVSVRGQTEGPQQGSV